MPMSIPDFQTLFLPVLKLSSTGEIHSKDAVSKLSDEFNLTEDERQTTVPSGSMTLMKNRVVWATTYLVKAGLVVRPQRGYFTATDRGKEVLSEHPEKINVKFLRQFPEFETFRTLKKPKESDSSVVQTDDVVLATPEERIGVAYEEITDEIKSELLSKVLQSSPAFFEKLIVKLLVAMGYGGSSEDAGKHIGKSGDEGVDGVIDEDQLGLDIIYIQGKRYAPENTIGRPEIQKFAGSLMGLGSNNGVFFTTSSFSTHAYDYAQNVTQRIILVDGEKLTSLMLEHNVGVRANQTIELKKIDEDFFME